MNLKTIKNQRGGCLLFLSDGRESRQETIISLAISFDPFHVFRVDDEASDYQVWVGGYTGNASDSLSAHNGYKFSTVDRNNDEAPKCCPCAPAYGGGWWFYR